MAETYEVDVTAGLGVSAQFDQRVVATQVIVAGLGVSAQFDQRVVTSQVALAGLGLGATFEGKATQVIVAGNEHSLGIGARFEVFGNAEVTPAGLGLGAVMAKEVLITPKFYAESTIRISGVAVADTAIIFSSDAVIHEEVEEGLGAFLLTGEAAAAFAGSFYLSGEILLSAQGRLDTGVIFFGDASTSRLNGNANAMFPQEFLGNAVLNSPIVGQGEFEFTAPPVFCEFEADGTLPRISGVSEASMLPLITMSGGSVMPRWSSNGEISIGHIFSGNAVISLQSSSLLDRSIDFIGNATINGLLQSQGALSADFEAVASGQLPPVTSSGHMVLLKGATPVLRFVRPEGY